MGFDIECIIDIHTYPGEFFCPVCRTLVYPNEALQSQCTHLYCKPCLAHVANSSRAFPHDGYLVTESESKPLIESNKALADKIGDVKVHCLFHQSGCTWESPISALPTILGVLLELHRSYATNVESKLCMVKYTIIPRLVLVFRGFQRAQLQVTNLMM